LGATIIYVTHDQVEAMTMADRIFIMSKGVLQQHGSPMEVYAQPANRFVAGFIGSPAMNFVEATLSATGDELSIQTSGFQLKMPESYRSRLEAYVGRPIVFGVRPEDIALHDSSSASSGKSTITARADVVETLGSEIFAHLSCGSDSIVARMAVPESPLTEEQVIQVDLNMSKVHVFDKENSITIV
jgi:multiple sugar transport system ATP-binding protein